MLLCLHDDIVHPRRNTALDYRLHKHSIIHDVVIAAGKPACDESGNPYCRSANPAFSRPAIIFKFPQ